MAATNYTPSNTFPDLDGSGGQGPLQLMADGDPYTYDVNIYSASANRGVIAKILDGLYYLKRLVQPTGSALYEQELRVVNQGVYSSTLTSNSVYRVAQSGVGTIPILTSKINSAADFFWLGLDLKAGAKLASCTIYTINAGNNNPATKATFQVLKYRSNTAETLLGSAANDVHTYGGAGNSETTVLGTSVPVSGTPAIDPAYRYALLVNVPYDGGVGPQISVYGLSVTYQ